MTLNKKLSPLFRKVLANGILCSAIAGLGAGAAVYETEATLNRRPLHDTAPVKNADLHDAAIKKLEGEVADVFAAASKVEFNAQSWNIQHGENIGKVESVASDIWAEHETGRNSDEKIALEKSLGVFRRDVILNPALSERDASAYAAIVNARLGEAQGILYLPPLSEEALSYRDETKVEQQVPENPPDYWEYNNFIGLLARKADDNDGRSIVPAFFTAPLAAGGCLFLLIAARRKVEEEEAIEKMNLAQAEARKIAAVDPAQPPDPAPAALPAAITVRNPYRFKK